MRTMPMPTRKDRTFAGDAEYCVCCGKKVNPKRMWAIHIINGAPTYFILTTSICTFPTQVRWVATWSDRNAARFSATLRSSGRLDAMASYKQAITWMVENDDTEWVLDEPTSVTAAFTADLFGKTDKQVRDDLVKALKKSGRLPKDAAIDPDA